MIKTLIKWLFPLRCIFCGKLLPPHVTLELCEHCYESLPFMDTEPLPVQNGNDSKTYCDFAVCLFEYKGMVKSSLKRYKFYEKSGYFRTYADLLEKRLKMVTDDIKFDIIVSVPLHQKRQCQRGYNQSQLLSKALSEKMKIPEASRFLSRIRNTGSQSLLGRQERFHNVKNAFVVTKASCIKGRNVLLVDDIMTTGSTIEACAKALKDAGAQRIVAVTVASGRKMMGTYL